jgi:hypothetical protein
MRALEDAGVKHNLVGRIARETFLPEKQYSAYVQSDTETFIDRGRPQHRTKYSPRGRRTREDAYDDREDDYNDERTRRPAQSRDDDMPWWAQSLIQRLDAIDGGGQRGGERGRDQSHIVVEPVLDEYGNPVPDPHNPGQYLERKIIYDPAAQNGGGGADPDVTARFEDMNATISKLQDTLAEHETERKISSAINPLLDKITGLEKRDHVSKDGMSNEQFKMQTEKEIFQDISTSVESTIANVIEPIVEGVTDMQRMTAMREIVDLERRDKVTPGTYLKYMAGGKGDGGENITKARVGGTIDMIKGRSKGVAQ